MAALYTTANTLITEHVTSVIPDYEIQEVENRLLDGSFHVQTIGQPARTCAVDLIVTSTIAKETIDTYKAIKTPVKVTADGKYYIGTIRGLPQWTKNAPGIYQTSLVLLVTEEGSV